MTSSLVINIRKDKIFSKEAYDEEVKDIHYLISEEVIEQMKCDDDTI